MRFTSHFGETTCKKGGCHLFQVGCHFFRVPRPSICISSIPRWQLLAGWKACTTICLPHLSPLFDVRLDKLNGLIRRGPRSVGSLGDVAGRLADRGAWPSAEV